jgi:hypothetical protein
MAVPVVRLLTYRFCDASSAVPTAEVIDASVTNATGVLALLNGALKRFTRLAALPTQKSPVGIKVIDPLGFTAPELLVNVAVGTLVAESGAAKNRRVPALSETTALPFESISTATTLLAANEKVAVEDDVIGSV